ncbi:hypothetical protein Agabi119p4_4020 [Agaricus bisporus var. burnettii]|uniref:FUN34 transmembrane protein n=1 Tax=Agaricus bisporus var. burnettii TaxID=192524 RepID=A0A8H7F2G5_AGABI|nr:hypothetical protein Agabi119p4_4020 [Agaricus bisporus var. burnettii]
MSEISKDLEKNGKSQAGPTLEYGDTRVRKHRMVNQVPMGIFSFAATTFLLSMFIVHTRNVQANNAVIGMAIFAGGLTQFLAGQWSIALKETYASTVLSSYGAFWMSYATIFIPGSGVLDAFGGPTEEFNQAFGLYLMVWLMITLMFIPPMLRKNLSFVILLSTLSVSLLLLAIGTWNGKPSVNKAGGAFGIMTGLIAFYVGVAMLMAAEPTALFHLPLGVWSED